MAKVTIVIVAGDMMHTKTAFDLARIVRYTSENLGHDVVLHHEGGSWIGQQRENAIGNVLNKHDPDWIFCMDSDMRVPTNAIGGLLEHNVPVVAANCVRRKRPITPIARTTDSLDIEKLSDGELVWEDEHSTGIQRVLSVGFGVMLVQADVFRQIGQPWFATPWVPEQNRYAGEDMYFCGKLWDAGIPLYIDHDLSWAVKHIGTYPYGHQEAHNDRLQVDAGEWEEQGFSANGAALEVVNG